jgi:hypothetical protein
VGVRADLNTSFDGTTLDSNLHLDVPDTGVGTITLDTINHNLLFSGAGADMWNDRGGLPFAWTAIPWVGVGGVWRAETEIQYNAAQTSVRIAGLTTYAGPDGCGGAFYGQEFTFGLDQWDGPNGVWVQGLGDNHPGDSVNLYTELIVNTVDLRMDVTTGESNANRYDFFYKLPSDQSWITLGTIRYASADDRVALFFKGFDMNLSFNYFNVTRVSVVPEPGSATLAGLGAISLLLARCRRKA